MSLTWLEISKSALAANISAFRKLAPQSKIMAVVKSNAYGHGLDIVPTEIQPLVDWFGVSSADEAIYLRDQRINKPILILSYFDEDKIEEVLRKNISLVVYDTRQLELLNTAALKLKTKAHVHVKIDTGMSRLGVSMTEAGSYLTKLNKLPGLVLEGVMSHFATGDDKPQATQQQLKNFIKITIELKAQGIKIPSVHMAATAAAVNLPDSRLNIIRLGIGLYGLTSYKTSNKSSAPKLTPALTLKSKIISIRHLVKGTGVGYGLSYRMKQAGTIAIMPVGYFEGYDRKLSNNSEVLINGVRCPVRGRVSMNLTAVEITNAPKVAVGDEVVLIGRQGKEEITVDELANKIKTINHEIITRINPLLPRTLVS